METPLPSSAYTTASPSSSESNPRKRGRTACTRCKNRKQKVSAQTMSIVSIISC